MKVIIVGGGIAGSVAGLAMQKAGIDSTILEAYSRSDVDVGSYFTISPNGLDALQAVDALELVKPFGQPTRHTVLWNGRGRRLGVAPLGAPLADGTPALTLKRSRLSNALLQEAGRRGIAVQYGKRLVNALTKGDGQVLVSLADGTTLTGDLLVGADGIHSVTRSLIDPAAPAGRYVGLTNFGGITRGFDPAVETEAWHMIFGRAAFFGYLVKADGDVVWFVNWPRPQISPDERDSTTNEVWKETLATLFAYDTGPAANLIRKGEFELAGDNTFDLGHVPVWHRGPMVIIGDAAHAPAPTSGQGASMAAEDGVVLAKALRDLPSIPEALESYEQIRRPRVEKIVANGARMSSVKAPGPVGRVVRDAMLPLVLKAFSSERSLGWQFDHRVQWDRPLNDAELVGI